MISLQQILRRQHAKSSRYPPGQLHSAFCTSTDDGIQMKIGKTLQFSLALISASAIAGQAKSQVYSGKSFKADVVALSKVCRVREGTCKDLETPSTMRIYFGDGGGVYIYIQSNQGLKFKLGEWGDDTQGHAIRVSVSGNKLIWEASSEKYLNTIVFAYKGNSCTATNSWSSENPDILLSSRGIVVNSCGIYPGNVYNR